MDYEDNWEPLAEKRKKSIKSNKVNKDKKKGKKT